MIFYFCEVYIQSLLYYIYIKNTYMKLKNTDMKFIFLCMIIFILLLLLFIKTQPISTQNAKNKRTFFVVRIKDNKKHEDI